MNPRTEQRTVYVCETCQQAYDYEDGAVRCCTCHRCHTPSKGLCDICKKEYERLGEERRVQNSKLVSYGLYDEEKLYDLERDRFFSDLEELYDFYEELQVPLPLYVYGVVPKELALDAGEILHDFFEGFDDDSLRDDAENSLQPILDRWCKKQNKASNYYEPDLTTRVEVPKRDEDE